MPKTRKRRFVLELRRKPLKRRKRTTTKKRKRMSSNRQGLRFKGVL